MYRLEQETSSRTRCLIRSRYCLLRYRSAWEILFETRDISKSVLLEMTSRDLTRDIALVNLSLVGNVSWGTIHNILREISLEISLEAIYQRFAFEATLLRRKKNMFEMIFWEVSLEIYLEENVARGVAWFNVSKNKMRFLRCDITLNRWGRKSTACSKRCNLSLMILCSIIFPKTWHSGFY